jgi:hypothetical protein
MTYEKENKVCNNVLKTHGYNAVLQSFHFWCHLIGLKIQSSLIGGFGNFKGTRWGVMASRAVFYRVIYEKLYTKRCAMKLSIDKS